VRALALPLLLLAGCMTVARAPGIAPDVPASAETDPVDTA
jgi:hypothetical protein